MLEREVLMIGTSLLVHHAKDRPERSHHPAREPRIDCGARERGLDSFQQSLEAARALSEGDGARPRKAWYPRRGCRNRSYRTCPRECATTSSRRCPRCARG